MDDTSVAHIAAAVAAIPGVVAVSLGGSLATGMADEQSDVDLHVYWQEPLAPAAERHAILGQVADAGTSPREVTEWGLEDHFYVDGRLVELVYVHLGDMRALVERAYSEGLGDEGFATAQLFYVAEGVPLHDPEGALAALRGRLAAYPEATRSRLLTTMPELLRAYLRQLRKAQARRDLLFVQHRRYSVQMVYFNMLFALNRRYHPGEKRLLLHAERCPTKPALHARRWEDTALRRADDPAVTDLLEALADELCEIASRER
ncbi:MAG: hypothetical protein RLZZ387_1889 [Chloroflexota bacterium]|jgi:predicted nucleotidyltransferase